MGLSDKACRNACCLLEVAAMKAGRELSVESMEDSNGGTSGVERELFTWWGELFRISNRRSFIV